MAFSMTSHMTQEGTGEVVHEVDVSPMGIDGEVDGVMYRRYIAIDVRIGIRTVISNSLDIDLLQFLIPLGVSMKHTHAPPFELEVADIEIGRGCELVEE